MTRGRQLHPIWLLGAFRDYQEGVPLKIILWKWKVPRTTFYEWLQKENMPCRHTSLSIHLRGSHARKRIVRELGRTETVAGG